MLEALAVKGFSGSVVVEVSTRRVSEEQREADLAESLAFARLHLAGLENIDGNVLSAAGIQRLHQPVLEYSCGWHEELIDGIPTSWHRGTCDTFDTFVLLQPSRDIGVIVFTNADDDNTAANALFAEMPKLAAIYASHRAG